MKGRFACTALGLSKLSTMLREIPRLQVVVAKGIDLRSRRIRQHAGEELFSHGDTEGTENNRRFSVSPCLSERFLQFLSDRNHNRSQFKDACALSGIAGTRGGQR
jgi:hypothetical protein